MKNKSNTFHWMKAKTRPKSNAGNTQIVFRTKNKGNIFHLIKIETRSNSNAGNSQIVLRMKNNGNIFHWMKCKTCSMENAGNPQVAFKITYSTILFHPEMLRHARNSTLEIHRSHVTIFFHRIKIETRSKSNARNPKIELKMKNKKCLSLN